MDTEKFWQYKKDNETNILIIKNGIFYYCYGDDAYIINYLFNYKLMKGNFPFVSFNDRIKVIIRLKKLNIGYVIIDKDLVREFGDATIYTKYLNLAQESSLKKDLIAEINLTLEKMSVLQLTNILNSYQNGNIGVLNE